jgi:hypothetical protein
MDQDKGAPGLERLTGQRELPMGQERTREQNKLDARGVRAHHNCEMPKVQRVTRWVPTESPRGTYSFL